jgi:hypothetical protein
MVTSRDNRPFVSSRPDDVATPPSALFCPICGTVLTDGKGSTRPPPAPARRARRIDPRFGLVNVLPTATVVVLLMALFASGAPRHAPDPRLLADRMADLTAVDVGAIAFVVLVVAVLTAPFQLGLVRMLEGYWDGSLLGGALAEAGLGLQRRRVNRLQRRARQPGNSKRIVRARQAAADRLATYPAQHLLPTRLGNALRAAEEHAGQRYGLDTVAVWPWLHPYLSPRLADTLASLRNQVDASARFCVGLLFVAAVALPMVAVYGSWLLVPALTAVSSWIAYRAAVRAAVAHGRQLYVAFDLHRFDMLRGLHLPLPADPSSEVRLNRDLSAFCRYGRIDSEARIPVDRYEHPGTGEAQEEATTLATTA